MRDKSNNTYVLIVGIDEYDREPSANLRGCRNDAISWWRLCVQRLLVPPSQITLLASPPVTVEELGGTPALRRAAEQTLRSGATYLQVTAAFEALANIIKTDERSVGLFTFAGHGVTTGPLNKWVPGDNLALCPQDARVDEDGEHNIIPLLTLEGALVGQPLGQRLTMVLDACYTGSGRHFYAHAQSHRSGASDMSPTDMSPTDMNPSDDDVVRLGTQSRLIMASQPWTAAYEIQIEGKWQGACSWMMTRLLERWSRKRSGAANYLNVSYHDLLFHAATGLPLFLQHRQVPMMWGERRLDSMAFLHWGPMAPGKTSSAPDRKEDGRQIPVTPGTVMFIEISGDDSQMGVVIINGMTDPRKWVKIPNGEDCIAVNPLHEGWVVSASSGDQGTITLDCPVVASTGTEVYTQVEKLVPHVQQPTVFVADEQDTPAQWTDTSEYSPPEGATYTYFEGTDQLGNQLGLGIAIDSSGEDVLDVVLYVTDDYFDQYSDGSTILLFSGEATGWGPVALNKGEEGPPSDGWYCYSYAANPQVGRCTAVGGEPPRSGR